MRLAAIAALALAGTSFGALTTGAEAQTVDTPGAALPAQTVPEPDDQSDIVVLGSRIPRVQKEGPAPVTTITADDFLRNGYQNVPDVLRAITQNSGETQGPQSYSANDFTPGAQQVDLRGLGPNHTLVLVNGRRIADFPLPLGGNSNFADISNIPIGLIERVEVLSGSASAIYGSDAISGVVNFKLKDSADGTRIDFRYGATDHGGGSSMRLTATTGWRTGGFHGVAGVELFKQNPLWMWERSRQDSTADNPTTETPLARRNFLRADEYVYYINPGKATCDALAYTNGGTTYYAAREGRDTFAGDGYFCGSNEAVAYGTMINERKAITGYTSFGYEFSDKLEFFVDAQASYSELKLMRDVLDWYYEAPDGNEEGTFYNPMYLAPDQTWSGYQLDNWSRLFTPEEMGGFEPAMTHNNSTNFNVTAGLKGKFGDTWAYEVGVNHAEYSSWVSFPQVIIDKSNALFLGQPVNDPLNDTGYARFDANPARLYKPLTPAEYASITAASVYKPKSWVNNLSAQVTNTELFRLPAGPVGFAAVAEIGNQGYDLNPDPLALKQYYVGIIDSDGYGKRNHWAVGGELRVPVLSVLELNGAGRYDHYSFGGGDIGKFTYNFGAELRPVKSLLLRAAYGTGFRAPDLNYVFRGPGNVHSGGSDYYLCRRDEPGEAIDDCTWGDEGFVVHKTGNRALQPETSTSLNAGAVFQPWRGFYISADYFRVNMKNQVLDQEVDTILRAEADCRLGQTNSGSPIDSSSPTCADAIARVTRYAGGTLDERIQAVRINPINIAEEMTDGIDVAANLQIPIHGRGAGTITANVSYTYVFNHTITQYPGDPEINKLAFDSDYYIPRDKGTASISWSLDGFTATVTGQRLGKLPNYDEDAYIKASYLFNLSAQYLINDHLQISGTINNLFDQEPISDPTWGSYPYYNSSWFDGVGRSYYLQLTWKFGGKPL